MLFLIDSYLLQVAVLADACNPPAVRPAGALWRSGQAAVGDRVYTLCNNRGVPFLRVSWGS